MGWSGQERSRIISQKVHHSSRGRGNWNEAILSLHRQLSERASLCATTPNPKPKSPFSETFSYFFFFTSYGDILCPNPCGNISCLAWVTKHKSRRPSPLHQDVASPRGVFIVLVLFSPPIWLHTVGLPGSFSSLCSQFLLFEVPRCVKITTNIKIANSETLFLGEVQG